MDIPSRISGWDPDHQRRLTRVRDYAIATITEPTFENSDDVTNATTTASGTRICKACVQIFSTVSDLLDKAQIEGRMGAHHIAMDYTQADLQASASLGCHMCSILEASVLRYIKNGKPSSAEFDAETAEDSWLWLTTNVSPMEEVRCDLKMGLINVEVLNDTGNELSFFPANLVSGEASQVSSLRTCSIESNTSDDSTYEAVASWLKTCQMTHDRCQETRLPETNVPRRLLQLDKTTVRVVENTSQYPYACLSHCWGSQTNVPHKPTDGAQYDPFSIADLPKTFQDAIEITKRLGLTHLWIDCFCIVQDSKQDWLEQSAVMAQIYASSTFTIAALTASDTHGGCFQDRNPLALQPLQAKDLLVRPRVEDNLWRLEIEGNRPESSPLHSRAWVVQERLSSARTIFYGALGVYWECRCMQASESHVKPIDDVTSNFKTLLRNLEAAATAAAVESLDNHNLTSQTTFLNRWQRLLQIYTVCALTVFSDKLIALSGITRDVEKYSGKRYVQGLWENDLPTGLLWVHIYSSSGITRDDSSGRVADTEFPSWSWASMRGEIMYLDAPGKVIWTPEVTIEEGCEQGRLCLKTWVREVRLSSTDEDYINLVDDGSKRGDIDEDYLWYHDEKTPEDVPMYIVLVQRISISEKPFLGSVRCVVVNCFKDNQHHRLGMTNIRFGKLKEDPFPLHEPKDDAQDVVLI